MSEGRKLPHGGATEIDADADEASDAAGTHRKSGWVALPPHADAPDGAPGMQRYRAPWATRTTASTARSVPPAVDPAVDPAASAAPSEAPGRIASRKFTLKRWGARPAAKPEIPDSIPAEPTGGPVAGPVDRPVDGRIDGPAAGAPPAPPPASGSATEPAPSPAGSRALEFTGSAVEYFRVWIVNVCLTVLTLGIYSAWAKVRTQRYFYRHTRLDGSPFDYLAEPKQILKGRVIVVLFMAAYSALGQTVPPLQAVLSIALVFLVPWAVVKSLRFRARYSAWRNIRFGFDGTYREALAVFVGWPMLVAFTFGLAYPYYRWRRSRFSTARSRFGTRSFGFRATPGAFYAMHMKAGALMLGLLLLAGLAGVVLPFQMHVAPFVKIPGSELAAGGVGTGAAGLSALAGLAIVGPVALGFLLVWTYIQARTLNVVWNGTTLGPHGFRCTVRARDLFRLYLMNTLGIIVSFGLLAPWARVRMARYRVETLQVTGAAALTDFVQGQGDDVGATGAEFGEAMDLDLGL
jgi:uncharacterized membrane protein YjgN (DUF898 family)